MRYGQRFLDREAKPDRQLGFVFETNFEEIFERGQKIPDVPVLYNLGPSEFKRAEVLIFCGKAYGSWSYNALLTASLWYLRWFGLAGIEQLTMNEHTIRYSRVILRM